MLRNVIESPKTVEIYKIDEDMKRGTLVVKNDATKTASKADGVGVDVYIVDYDSQPTGCYSDVELSAYSDEMDIVKANSMAILVTYDVGGNFATDQVEGTFANGDYAIADGGKFAPATTGDVSKFKYVGEYQDGGKTLQQFRVVDPTTVS